ncbi:MAG: T9SS type A sorting domain-containing protein [Ignavibacteriales bacterium]|nr:T9SS type A sorting domain-containing protein [Ignavibacteriales bacterium]
MKKGLLFVFVLLLASTMFAQWTEQTSGVTTTLQLIVAVDDNVLWACGSSGVVLLTTDGGTTWVKKTPTDATVTNYSVAPLDATTAWVTGTVGGSADCIIWKTTDGGTTWVQQYRNPTGFTNGMVMFDANNGVCWGDPDPYPSTAWEIVTTTDGGTTWTRVPRSNYTGADSANGEYGSARGICKSGNTVWFTGYSAVAGTPNSIYKSTDKGLHWTRSTLNKVSGTSGSGYLAFANSNQGVFVGLDGTRAVTIDGGTTWTVATNTTPALRALTYVPGTTSFIATGSSGASLISRDYGVTWEALTGAPAVSLYGVTATSNNAWTCGATGKIAKLAGTANVPVELKSFSAKVVDGKANLEWFTVTETNNKGFEVERNISGVWAKVGYVDGSGTKTTGTKYTFVDDIANLKSQSLSYRLKQIDLSGTYEYSAEVQVNNLAPSKFDMSQNYPNPFNPATTIKYALPFESIVNVTVYNSLGQIVSELVNKVQQAGYYEENFNASNLSSGTYIYQIKAVGVNGGQEFSSVKKMILVK